MNQTELIKRAWRITWRYRVLWLFGILLALAGGGGGGGGAGGGGGRGGDGGRGGVPPIRGLDNFDPGKIIGIIAVCCCILFVVVIVMTIVQYVARAALYRSVDQIEKTGVAPTWREGFGLGWTNRAFRLFLLELVVGIAVVLAALLLAAVAAAPLLLLLAKSGVLKGIGIGLTIWLGLVWILLLIVAAVILSVLGQFWSREIILADRSIGEALASGYHLVRGRLKDVAIMWLLMFAIGLGFGVVLIPVVLAVIVGAGAVGAAVGFAIHAATHSIIWAVAGGLPLFLLITVIPLSIIQGIYLAFETTAWTLTYREVALGKQPTPDILPAPATA